MIPITLDLTVRFITPYYIDISLASKGYKTIVCNVCVIHRNINTYVSSNYASSLSNPWAQHDCILIESCLKDRCHT